MGCDVCFDAVPDHAMKFPPGHWPPASCGHTHVADVADAKDHKFAWNVDAAVFVPKNDESMDPPQVSSGHLAVMDVVLSDIAVNWDALILDCAALQKLLQWNMRCSCP